MPSDPHPLRWLTTEKIKTLVRRGHAFDIDIHVLPHLGRSGVVYTATAKVGEHGLRWSGRAGLGTIILKYDAPSGLMVVEYVDSFDGKFTVAHVETKGHLLWCDLPPDTGDILVEEHDDDDGDELWTFQHRVPIRKRLSELMLLRRWTPSGHRRMPEKLKAIVRLVMLARHRQTEFGVSNVLPLEMWWTVFGLIDPFDAVLE